MARGNLVMGTARGKLGEVVFSRKDGQQISRQYIKKVKNPKTQGQQIQRAVMATVAKMYGMGKEIFDHSFQGKGVPSGSMRRFLKVNADALRASVIYSIENGQNKAFVCSPSALSATPNEYIISEGTFKPAPFYAFQRSFNGYYVAFNQQFANTLTVRELFTLLNIEPNDVFTMALMTAEEGTMSQLTSPTTHFGTLRLIAKSLDAATAEMTVATATIGDAFTVSSVGLLANAAEIVSAKELYQVAPVDQQLFNLVEIVPSDQTPACVGFIASHVGSKQRSSATMKVLGTKQVGTWTVKATDLSEAWASGSSYAPSDLYLEGQGNAPSIMPENYVTLQTLGGGDVDIVGVKFVENDGVVLAKAVDVDGAEYYVKNDNNRSDYYGKALTKLFVASESAPALPADSDNNNTIGFNAYTAESSLKNAAFGLFYGGGVDPSIASDFFLF